MNDIPMRRSQPDQGNTGAGQRAKRWAGWAQRLSERYTRRAARQSSPAFVLPHPAGPGERWIRAAWTFSPHIHLALHVLPAGGPASEGAQTGASWRYFPSNRRGPVSTPAYPHVERRFTPGAQLSGLDGSGHFRPSASFPGFAAALAVSVGANGGQISQPWTPLSLPYPVDSGILPRLVAGLKRIEQRPPAAPVVLASAPPRGPAPRTHASAHPGPLEEEQVFELPAHFRGKPAMAIPPTDLERLTEQVVRKIDERIVAHRERLGRVF